MIESVIIDEYVTHLRTVLGLNAAHCQGRISDQAPANATGPYFIAVYHAGTQNDGEPHNMQAIGEIQRIAVAIVKRIGPYPHDKWFQEVYAKETSGLIPLFHRVRGAMLRGYYERLAAVNSVLSAASEPEALDALQWVDSEAVVPVGPEYYAIEPEDSDQGEAVYGLKVVLHFRGFYRILKLNELPPES